MSRRLMLKHPKANLVAKAEVSACLTLKNLLDQGRNGRNLKVATAMEDA